MKKKNRIRLDKSYKFKDYRYNKCKNQINFKTEIRNKIT